MSATKKDAKEKWMKETGGYVEEFAGKNCEDIEDNFCSGWQYGERRCD